MSASLANGNRETGEEEGNGGGTFDTLESFVQDQVVKHEHALHELLGTEGEGGDGERSEDMLAKSVKVLAKKTMDLALAFREKEEQLQQARETLHIERTRRQTSAIQVEEREAQLTKAQDYSRKHEKTFKKAARLQEEAQRRLETQYRESELRHERRHEQELKLRLDLEQRMDSLRDTEKQLRDRLAQERRAREAAEGAQRQMLQRHLALQLVKSPPTASASQEGTADSAGAEGPLSLGYTLDNVREITMMNHNLVSARETASIEKAKELAAQLKAKDHDLEKSKLSLKRVEHHNAKLIEENEEMMEALGLFNMESRPTTPGHGTPANGQGLGPSTVGALSVLASTETTLSTAVIQTIGASFVDFYRHLETLLNEVVVESAHADAGDRHVLVNKLVASSQETCKLCIESAVNRVLLEILEDDRPLIINGKAHSTYQLFEKVSKEMTRLRGELEEWKQKPQSQAHANSPIFLEFNEVIKELEECQRERETLRKDLDECQSEREILRTECHKLQGRLIVASTPSPSTDLRVGKLEQTIEKLREENKALLHHQASADEHKENLEKKVSELQEKEVEWEKSLKRLKKELKSRAGAGAGAARGPPRSKPAEANTENAKREAALRSMLLERVNKSLAAVAGAREADADAEALGEDKGKDPTFENWQAISDFTSRLSEDGVTPASRPVRQRPLRQRPSHFLPRFDPSPRTCPLARFQRGDQSNRCCLRLCRRR